MPDGEGDGETPQGPTWVPDSEVALCMECKAKFGMRRRKHHCRMCGGVFCDKCSGNKIAMPELGHQQPQRICQPCFTKRLREDEERHKKEQAAREEEEERAQRQRENDEDYVSSIYDTDGLILEILRYLQGGCDLLVLDATGERKKRRFWLNRHPAALCWADPNVATQGTDQKTHIPAERILVSDIRDLVLGPFSATLKKHVKELPDYYRSFTISGKGGRDVDCVAEQLVDFEAWVLGIAHLLNLDPQWGEPLKMDKQKRVKELDDKEKEYLAKYHIQPSLYFDARDIFKERGQEVAHQRWLFDGDMEKVWLAVGGAVMPELDEHGALLVTKGELRFETELDIFRAANLWRILAHQHIIFDPEFRPAVGPGSQDPAMVGYKRGELPDPAEVERRIDPADGNAYTRQEFVAEYKGTKEWDEARPRAASSSSVSDLRRKGSTRSTRSGSQADEDAAQRPRAPPQGTPKQPAPKPKERGRDVPGEVPVSANDQDAAAGDLDDVEKVVSNVNRVVEVGRIESTADVATDGADGQKPVGQKEERKIPKRLARALVAGSTTVLMLAAWEEARAARKREKRLRKMQEQEGGAEGAGTSFGVPPTSFATTGADLARHDTAEKTGATRQESVYTTATAATDDGADIVWSEEGRAEVERILTEYAPKRLKKVPKLLREWQGKEDELLAALREQFCPAEGDAS